jgi:hypothetical protein
MRKQINYSNSFLGTVIRNSNLVYTTSDTPPTPDGRVLVKIDGISPSVRENESFKFPIGSNVEGAVDINEVKLLNHVEVMCYIGAPVTGNDGAGMYCAKYNQATTSESNDDTLWFNNEENGFAPADMFKGIRDIFTGLPDSVGVPLVNTYGAAYQSDYRTNQARGNHAVPGVGARVVVQFLNGSRRLPYVSHILHGTNDITSIRSTDNGKIFPGYPYLASNISV